MTSNTVAQGTHDDREGCNFNFCFAYHLEILGQNNLLG